MGVFFVFVCFGFLRANHVMNLLQTLLLLAWTSCKSSVVFDSAFPQFPSDVPYDHTVPTLLHAE